MPARMRLSVLLPLLLLALTSSSADAVIILDSTWAAEGGSAKNPAAGFDAAKDLANQRQFAATMAFAENDDGEGWGVCSGIWIGNDGEHGYLLTAAHCFGADDAADKYVYRSYGGSVYQGSEVLIHPDFVDEETTTGYDLAIVTLDAPVIDAGRQPLLYGGSAEQGKLLTFIGYGSRGIGSKGQRDKYYDGAGDKAAAQGIIDVVQDGPKDDADLGDYLGTFLPKEDGSLANPYDGADTPASRLAGLLGSGDSGGSAFLKVGKRWLLAGVNSNGGGKAQYGDSSWFVRISARQDWILENAPVARFAQ